MLFLDGTSSTPLLGVSAPTDSPPVYHMEGRRLDKNPWIMDEVPFSLLLPSSPTIITPKYRKLQSISIVALIMRL